MKKKISLFFAILVIVVSILKTMSFAAEDFEYTINNNKAIISKYNGNATNLVIPNEINGYEVIIIGENAFYGCKSLVELTVPSSVLYIGISAFEGCTNLTTATIYGAEIGPRAFCNCSSLTNITMKPYTKIQPDDDICSEYEYKKSHSENERKLDVCAFSYCPSLEAITIPDGVQYIGPYQFMKSLSIKKVMIPSSVNDWGQWLLLMSDFTRNNFAMYGYESSKVIDIAASESFGIEVPYKILNPNNTYTIVFKDRNGNVLKTENVAEGQCATPPNAPVIDGFIFNGWSANYAVVMNNLTVYAKYKRPEGFSIPNYVFDSRFYADINPDLKNAFGYNETALKNHYNDFGIGEGRKASPVFDPIYYLNKYTDLRKEFGNSYEKAYSHFVNYGIKEGRQGSKDFDVKYYVNEYPDLKKAYGNNYIALAEHFVNFGRFEGRVGSRETPINISGYIFDSELYYNLYPDLQRAFGYNENALRQHYLNFGINEGRLGSYVFDVTYYKNKYKDLKNMTNKDAYNHFVNYGIHEGRAGSQMFDVVHYLFYHDLTVAFGKNYSRALQHFVCCGINEARTSSYEFMANVYKKENSDLAKAFGNNWKQYYKHYLIWGRHEGRIYKLFQK